MLHLVDFLLHVDPSDSFSKMIFFRLMYEKEVEIYMKRALRAVTRIHSDVKCQENSTFYAAFTFQNQF